MGSAPVIADSPTGVLRDVRAHRAAAEAHESAILRAAAEWADLHPPESLDDAAYVDGTEGEVAIAGPGAPLVAEFACAEFASALGVPTAWGIRWVGDALELRHRLPRLWARVMESDLPTWRGRRISQATRRLSPEAADWVDAQVAPFAHKIGPAQTDRLMAAAIARFDPELAEQERRAAADRRCFTVDHHQVSFAGTSRVYGELDLADALDLDAAVSAGADALLRLGSIESLDVRRAQAVGELARRQPTFELPGVEPEQPAPKRSQRVRQVVTYEHLSESALSGGDPVARVENAGGVRLVTAEQVRDWCGNQNATVVVKPVIDLAEHVSVDAYEVPDRLDERAGLTHPTCVFPWCTRPPGRCDKDHGVPYDDGGPTCDCNLTPLCRFHHRLKTHGLWLFTRPDETTLLWRSPNGLTFLRDHTGTRDVTDDRPVDPPDEQAPRPLPRWRTVQPGLRDVRVSPWRRERQCWPRESARDRRHPRVPARLLRHPGGPPRRPVICRCGCPCLLAGPSDFTGELCRRFTKPDPQMLLETCQRLSAEPAACMMVGDTPDTTSSVPIAPG